MHFGLDRRVSAPVFVVLLLFFVLSAIQASRPLNLDNADLPVWAKAVADTGKPVAYRGEDRLRDKFVYHTPLYLYALGAWFKLLGYGFTQIRMFGAVCVALFGAICLEFVRAFFGRGMTAKTALFFWPIFLLNPYTLQCASIADIDTTIYGPLLCGFLLSIVRLCWRDGMPSTHPPETHQFLLPSVLLAACFWAKLTTVLLFVPVPFFIFAFRFGRWRSLRQWAVVTGLGLCIFVITYTAWCSWMAVSYKEPLRWLASYPSAGTATLWGRLLAYYGTFKFMLPFTIKWTGVTTWGAAGVALWICISKAVHKREEYGACAVILFIAFFGTFVYAAIRPTFGNAPYKYYFPFWGLACLAFAVVLGFCVRERAWGRASVDDSVQQNGRPRLSLAAWAGAALFITAVYAGDVLVQDNSIREGTGHLKRYAGYWLGPPLAASVAIMAARLRRTPAGMTQWILLSLFLVSVGLQTGICVFQVRQPYSTTYNYGQVGLAETATFVRAVTSDDDIVFCMKDLGPMSGRRYYESYSYLYGGPEWAQKAAEILSKKIKLAIFTEQIGEDQLIVNAPLRDWVGAHCELVRSIGNYRVYSIKREPAVPKTVGPKQ